MTISVTLPWFDPALKPNSRPHWATKARAVKTSKTMAAALARIAAGGKLDWPSAKLHWTFHPKTRNAVDADNCIAAAKAYQDGISLAIGIDDSRFHTSYTIGPPIKGGAVIVTIQEG